MNWVYISELISILKTCKSIESSDISIVSLSLKQRIAFETWHELFGASFTPVLGYPRH